MVIKMGLGNKAMLWRQTVQHQRYMATGAIDKAKVVIIGGGTAGITVAAHLRDHVKGEMALLFRYK
jgi:NADH dehydrogenase FAD-containing subunit